MLKHVQKVDSKHKKNFLVFAYENTKNKLKSDCKDSLIQKLVQSLANEEKSPTLNSFRYALDDGKASLFVANLGEQKSLDSDTFRQKVAEVYRKLESEKISHLHICADSLSKIFKDQSSSGRLLAEAWELSAYNYKNLTKKEKDQELVSAQIGGNKTFAKGIKEGLILADAVNFSRELGDMPANLLTPTALAKKTQAKAKNTKIKVSVWDKTRIQKEKFGAMLGVARGSNEPPKVIWMEYRGGPKSQKPLTFVGKGLTFDAGGISIKPSAGMQEMKYDMCGGANVIGAMFAIAGLGLKVNVNVIVGATENLLGGSATKPGDVLTARNGKTIEVNNTDAEGRLVLADLLSYVSEKKPSAIVDAATLTGAMVVALGNIHTGFYTSDDKLAKKVEAAAKNADERVWRMPVTKFHTEDMKGTYADLSNLGATRGAGSATAAAFLKEFVPEEISYVHFDIAGTAWNCSKRSSLFREGATGSMVKTFTEIAKNWK